MIVLSYKNRSFETKDGESVLDALLRHDINIPYACKAGVCHVCVMQCQQGSIPTGSAVGLKDSQTEKGDFLACQCIPTEDLSICDAEELGLFGQVKVIQKDYLSTDVCRLRMRTATDLYYRAGQFLNLRMTSDDVRSYSLASLPTQDEYLELHIKRMRNGIVSNWLFKDVNPGDILEIQGPFGDCFYMPGNADANILMIGTGTGLAPLYGILREAIAQGHQGQISLYHGEYDANGLYLDDELNKLIASHENIHYFPCASSKSDSAIDNLYIGKASDLAFANNPNLVESLIYLCGSPSMVDESRHQALLNGARLSNINMDPFISKDLRQEVRHI